MRGQDETVVGHGLPFACAAFCLLLLCLLLPVLQSTPCTGLSILNNNRHIVQGLGALATLSDSNPFCHLQLLQVGRRPPHLPRAPAGRHADGHGLPLACAAFLSAISLSAASCAAIHSLHWAGVGGAYLTTALASCRHSVTRKAAI